MESLGPTLTKKRNETEFMKEVVTITIDFARTASSYRGHHSFINKEFLQGPCPPTLFNCGVTSL
jgi:hypothetical protein